MANTRTRQEIRLHEVGAYRFVETPVLHLSRPHQDRNGSPLGARDRSTRPRSVPDPVVRTSVRSPPSSVRTTAAQLWRHRWRALLERCQGQADRFREPDVAGSSPAGRASPHLFMVPSASATCAAVRSCVALRARRRSSPRVAIRARCLGSDSPTQSPRRQVVPCATTRSAPTPARACPAPTDGGPRAERDDTRCPSLRTSRASLAERAAPSGAWRNRPACF